MTQITTSGGNIIFQDTVTGLTKQIGQNRLWISFKADTVNFLQVDIPTDGYDGTPFWAVRATNLTINGESYTIEELKSGEGLSDLFTGASFGYLIVDSLPDEGEPNIIYLVYDDETGTYVEYLWLSQEETWEELGSVGDVELTNYYDKDEIDLMLQSYAETSDLATVATSGDYDDLTNKPVIPDAQVQANWGESDTTSKAYIQNKPTIPTVDQTLVENSTNAAQSGATYTALQGKQATLISGTTIKTINNESLLGSGNINISGGSAQVQSDWTETNTESMAYIQHKPSLATVATTGAYSDLSGTPTIPTVPTNVSAFTNDAGYLTQHQSLADVFGIVDYDSSTKHINFYGKDDTSKTTVLGYVDATNFVVDGMVSNVEVKSVTISGTPTTCLVITFNSDAGKQDINIPISQIFDASNYYTKSEVDTALSGKASTSSLATVATTGAYSDLTGTPTIPAAQVQADWNESNSSSMAYIANKPTIPTVDSAITQNSTNAVQSGAVYTALQGKQDTLTAGTNITIATDAGTGDLVISATGGGGSGTVTGVKMNNGSPISPDANGVVDLGTVITAHQTVDTVLSQSSNNPIANSTVYAAIGDIEAALQAINGTTNA